MTSQLTTLESPVSPVAIFSSLVMPASSVPNLGIPPSSKTVSVSIIDSTSYLEVPASRFTSPPIPGFEMLKACAFSFLVEHASDADGKPPRRLIFDLGVRKDWQSGFSPAVQEGLKHMTSIPTSTGTMGCVRVETDVHSILRQHGVDPDSVEAIVWSHTHLDHTGDPSTFGPGTALVVGPGFGTSACGCATSHHYHSAAVDGDAEGDDKDQPLAPHIFPGYPADPDSTILESDYKGRELRVLTDDDFDKHQPGGAITIGGCRALDYFGDGSFYLLDTPGHSAGHLCGLARVKSSASLPNGGQFILMGGDTIHHLAELRPNPHWPLPDTFTFESKGGAAAGAGNKGAGAATALSTVGLLPYLRDRAHPFWVPAGPKGKTVHLDPDEARATAEKLQAFDADENILIAPAHDHHLFDLLAEDRGFFPRTANDFVAQKWPPRLRWAFLQDFAHLAAAEGQKPAASA